MKATFDEKVFNSIYGVSNPRGFDVDEWERKLQAEIEYSIDFISDYASQLSLSQLNSLKFTCDWNIKTAKEEIPQLKKSVKTNAGMQNFLNAYQYKLKSNTSILKVITKEIKKKSK